MMKETMTDTQTDWRYSDERMEYRQAALRVLLARFGHQLEGGVPVYSTQSIYECAHDWVSQGNVRPDGIVKYYLAYYDTIKRSDPISEESSEGST